MDTEYDILKDIATHYFLTLRSDEGKTGMGYFKGRKLSDDTMHRFGLGYSKDRNEINSPINFLFKKGYTKEDIINSGIAEMGYDGILRDRFRNRVIFPIMDVKNRVIGFGGRVMGMGEPKYKNSPSTKVFEKKKHLYGMNIAKNTRENNFILCEGYMDVIMMYQNGVDNAVASLGTAFTEEQAELIKQINPEATVKIAYDTDAPGIKAAVRAIKILNEKGIKAEVISFDPCKDPDEFAKTYGKKALMERTKETKNGITFLLEHEDRGKNDDRHLTDFEKALEFRYKELTKDITPDQIRNVFNKNMEIER